MSARRAVSKSHELLVPDLAIGCSAVIFSVASACVLVGIGALAAWWISGDPSWIREFFEVPAALMMVWLAGVEFWLGAAARRHFAPGELMRRVWTLVTCSAASSLVGAVLVQIFGTNSRINLLTRLPGWTQAKTHEVNTIGHLFGGPIRFVLLAGGIWYALVAYRRARLLGRLRPMDWVAIGLTVWFVARNVQDVVLAVRAGKVVGWVEAANWPTDPLLCLLLILALRLYRSVAQMGGGWIGRCWRALSLAVFLTVIGDIGTWAEAWWYIRPPWTAPVWFVWLPAAACYALAPAYQLDAIASAKAGRLPHGPTQ